MITLFQADLRGDRRNTSYPHMFKVGSAEELAEVVGRDYTCALYANDHRKIENFLESDCLAFDLDNTHSDDPADWVTPADIQDFFPGVGFLVHYSQNNMKPKEGREPRPKFHVFFPVPLCTDGDEYAALKQKGYAAFPYFDPMALDAGRFFFGTEEALTELWPGDRCILDYLDGIPAAAPVDIAPKTAPSAEEVYAAVIPQGARNTTMHRFALKVLKRYGSSERAYALFLEESARCVPPLEEKELDCIWKSACKFYQTKIVTDPNYEAPDSYNNPFGSSSLRPPDYSDIGEGKVLVREYKNELCYTDATDFLRYDGQRWVESKQRAVGAAEEFLDLQLANAEDQVRVTEQHLQEIGVSEKLIAAGAKAIEKAESEEAKKALLAWLGAKAYYAFVMKRRDMKYVISSLQAAKPTLQIDIGDLDANPFLVNTPAGTYDLRKGLSSCKKHDPLDRITKITAFSPSEKGKELWLSALDTFFCGDEELIRYVQEIAGLAVIGKIYLEAIIIAYGEGRNGKSTFWNSISRVLGSYSGQISADTLTVGCKRNVKPEMAELKGKRMVIAAELEEGTRLNTSMIKNLCSTDAIYAEKKYRDPFSFVPSHTLVLYTNHLPKVGAADDGTWRRLIVIPFNAKIQGSSDRKNYADFLVENSGEYILKWIIEGAMRVIAKNYSLSFPACVREAIRYYRENNDWLGNFFDECCEFGAGYSVKAAEFYLRYKEYSERVGEYKRNIQDFTHAVEQSGVSHKKTNKCNIYEGVRLKKEGFEADF